MQKVNIFICTTPFQVFYCQEIVDNYYFGKENYNFIYTSCSYNITNKNVNEIIIADKTFIFKQIFSTWYALFRIRNLVTKFAVEFNFAHTSGIVANYCFEKYIKKSGKPFNLFYEGILAFYKYEETKNSRHFFRNIASLIYGFNYRYNKEIVPVDAPQLRQYYTPFPSNTRCVPEKVVKLPFSKRENISKENNLLIIGGLIKTPGDKIEWKNLLKKIVYLKKDGKVFFKKHPDDKKNNLKKIFEELDIEGIEIVSIEIVENLIIENKIKLVFSLHLSSALFNLRAIYGEQLELYYGMKNKTKQLNVVYKYAEKLNIVQL